MTNDPFLLAGKNFESRLLMGSSGFSSQQVMMQALIESRAQIVTVAVRRINLQAGKDARNLSVQNLLREKAYTLLPNTAGCYTAEEAVFAAELAREALQTDWVKLEVVGERETLYPDAAELLRAAETLVKKGFTV
ncbi:MAG: thiazole synthase, partial [Proteobacteria bacterium]|nr:thiazole synthase [Pseudomonadota bacterium]